VCVRAFSIRSTYPVCVKLSCYSRVVG